MKKRTLLLLAILACINIVAQEEEDNSKIQISIMDIEGVDERIILKSDSSRSQISIMDIQSLDKIIEYESDSDKPFVVVEVMPSYPGGEAEMMRFIMNNLSYPLEAAEHGIQGRVILRFVVQKDGSIANSQVIRGVDPILDKEALRVVNSMPKWKPGKQNGAEVPVYFTLPIIFKLKSETKE